jgi:hypothetical protein
MRTIDHIMTAISEITGPTFPTSDELIDSQFTPNYPATSAAYRAQNRLEAYLLSIFIEERESGKLLTSFSWDSLISS